LQTEQEKKERVNSFMYCVCRSWVSNSKGMRAKVFHIT